MSDPGMSKVKCGEEWMALVVKSPEGWDALNFSRSDEFGRLNSPYSDRLCILSVSSSSQVTYSCYTFLSESDTEGLFRFWMNLRDMLADPDKAYYDYHESTTRVEVQVGEWIDILLFHRNLDFPVYSSRPYVLSLRSEKGQDGGESSIFLSDEDMEGMFHTWLRIREAVAGNE